MARNRFLAIVGVVAVLTVFVLAVLAGAVGKKPAAAKKTQPKIVIAENEPDPAVWGKKYPREYNSYMKTLKTSELEDYGNYGKYGGAAAFSKLDKNPNLKRMYAGYSFSVEYREERGHMNALVDMLSTKRLGDKKPGPCMTCKSSQNPAIFKQVGEKEFYNTPVTELVSKFDIKHPVSCADCHDAKTMNLRVTRPSFIRAMASRGVDVSKASKEEMRAYVCGQCHVEYFWKKSDMMVTYPWSKGFTVDDIEAYYDELGFEDWKHEETGASMVKVQHPEFEMWNTGIHAKMGVSCPDCHMPPTGEGSAKYTDHWIRTPLVRISPKCVNCHGQSEKEIRDRVIKVQDRTYDLLKKSEDAIIAAMDDIKLAMQSGATDDQLKKARALHRKAQIRWDFVCAENSMGFHSSQEAARMLEDSAKYAGQASLEARGMQAKR